MKLYFLGGAGTVTGSKTVIEHENIRILIDCGMFQGVKNLRELNREPLAIPPETIDYVILTHGHLDHCGWLPKLVAAGFKGKIFCSRPTKEIARLILYDSAKIQEEDARKANEEQFSVHFPATPLYTIADVDAVIPKFRVVEKDIEIQLEPTISFHFFYAGHILGACSIALQINNKTMVFSGDIGQNIDVLMFPPKKPKKADYVFLESTYGNRNHPENNTLVELETIITTSFLKGGSVIIPSFAVERVQTMMYLIWQLKKENRIPDIPYIIDTPMGISVLDVFQSNRLWHKLSFEEVVEMQKVFTLISDYQESMNVVFSKNPKVVIAASGMLTGGRVLSYLEQTITKAEHTILLVGYQAEGTRGRKLLEGAKEIKIHGNYYPVHANIMLLENLSAHADQTDLVEWLSELDQPPQKVFLIHGENQAAVELRIKIKERYNYECKIPFLGQILEIK